MIGGGGLWPYSLALASRRVSTVYCLSPRLLCFVS